MKPAAVRRLLHASTAAILLVAFFGSVGLLRYTLAGLAAIALLLDCLRVSRPAVGSLFRRLVPVFRGSEAHRLSGATWLCIGYAAAAWCPLPAATAGILAGAFADPAASLVGSAFNREGLKKTWAGSAAAAVVAVLVLLPIGIQIGAVLAGALAAMVLERWPGPLDDNLVVAPGVALVVLLVM